MILVNVIISDYVVKYGFFVDVFKDFNIYMVECDIIFVKGWVSIGCG